MAGSSILRAAGGYNAPGGGSSVQSLSFDGTGNDERVEIDITGGVSANVANTDFTVEVWIRPTSNNNQDQVDCFDGNIFIDGDNLSGNGGAWLMSINGNVVDVGLNPESVSLGNPSGYQTFSGTTTVNNDAWHWIVMTYDLSTGDLQLYVDGTREINTTASPLEDGNVHWESGGGTQDQLLVLGREKQEINANGGYHGLMSELRISNSILYSTASITVPTSPLTASGAGRAYYGFTEGSGTLLEDTGGGTNSDGTIVGAAWNAGSPY